MMRSRKLKYKNDFDQEKLKFLITGEITSNPANAWDSFKFEFDKKEQKIFWMTNRKSILRDFITDHPGQRPFGFWLFDAPEPRQRLGGVGTPDFEVLGVVPSFSFGIPDSYIDEFQADYYNGRAKDIHGATIPCKWKEGNFQGLPVDPDDPPVYESEAAYLKRHGLLTKSEKKLLKLHKCK